MKFATNPPQTDSTEARVRVSAENVADGEMGYSGTGMVNLALADSFAIRATGYYRDQGGFVDSIGTAGSDVEEDINGSKSYGGRFSALLAPSDAFSARLTAVIQNIRNEAGGDVESDAPRSTRCTAGCRSRSSCPSTATSTTASTTRRWISISASRRSRPPPATTSWSSRSAPT